ncbi:MAG TPA: response regulator [Blastocatellia bacterium]|nr:response regulator [Blastocatellia bacterium]
MAKALVLVAEDDTDTRETVRELLETEGFDVVAAEDLILAYGLLSANRPDVILADIMMPKLDGIGFIRWVKSNPDFSDIPIIAMTAYDEKYLVEAKASGAVVTIRKPMELPFIAEAVSRLLSATSHK